MTAARSLLAEITFVASRAPPSPASITATSTFSSANKVNAMAVRTSK
uniref:Uncharacterized protein n=1 Tax=Rhizophora mucronata TaxID=61149 RepID=A0A2P2NBH8_RHIMU